MTRIAAPMVGGMVSAPLLSMFVIPAAWWLLHRDGACGRPVRRQIHPSWRALRLRRERSTLLKDHPGDRRACASYDLAAVARAIAQLFLPELAADRDDSGSPFQLAGSPGEFFFCAVQAGSKSSSSG